MSFLLVGAGIAAAGAVYNVGSGIAKTSAAKKLAAGNIRPWYNIPTEYYQNDNLAAQQAETGLSPSSINFYNTNANRGLTTGTNAILEGGGDVDNLAKIYDQFSQGLSQETAEDQNLKSQHLNTFINANKDLAGQQTQQWSLNYYDPYKDTAQLASAEKAGGQQQIQSGIGELVGTASALSKSTDYGDGSASAGSSTSTSTPALPAFDNSNKWGPYTTAGGSAVMGQLSKTDAYSSPLQQLIAQFKQQQLSQPVN